MYSKTKTVCKNAFIFCPAAVHAMDKGIPHCRCTGESRDTIMQQEDRSGRLNLFWA